MYQTVPRPTLIPMPWGDDRQCGRLGSGQWLVGGIHRVSGHVMGSQWCVWLFHSCWTDSICMLGLDLCWIYGLEHLYTIDCWSFCMHGLWIMLLMWMTWKRCDNWPNRWYSSVPRNNECIAPVVVDQLLYCHIVAKNEGYCITSTFFSVFLAFFNENRLVLAIESWFQNFLENSWKSLWMITINRVDRLFQPAASR